ncbi:MAG: restriction endonuclease subunit S, partial [Bacteroidia bacterium]|nr:restriction endonuclease subunit S [Bacteroidia bacterium]
KVFDVCELAYGKSLTSDSRIPGDYPVYGSAGEVGTHTNYLIDGPGIIIGRKGSVGTVYYEKRNFFPIDTSYYVIPKDGNDLRFLYYKFQTLGLNKLNSDAAVPGLNRNVAYEQSSIYPPLPTQRKIASILSAYDDLIENNLKRIKLLEEKAFLSYKQIVREEKLEKYILSDFGDIITGKTPSTTIADYFGDDVPFIKTPDMHNQIFIEHTDQMLSELGAKSQEKKFLPPLSLCVSCIGTAGVVGITSKPSQTNQQINSIVFYEPKNVYFFYALMSQMKEQLDALGSNGSTFTNVNKNKFENMEVFVPNQKTLNEFAEEFEAPFKLILTLQKQNTKLREARDILLPKLMNGQIEV